MRRVGGRRNFAAGGQARSTAEVPAPTPSVDIVAWNDALAELATLDPRPSQVVALRFLTRRPTFRRALALFAVLSRLYEC
jgi:hypothetical protein